MNISKSIIKSAIHNALWHLQKDSRYNSISDFPQLSNRIRSEVINSIWDKALNSNKGYDFVAPSTNAEAAVAACIHAGLDKLRIRYETNIYTLRMAHMNYRVYRELTGYTAVPEPALRANYVHRHAIGFDRDRFVEFLFTFDHMMPEIQTAIDELLVEVRALLVERDKERMINRILAVSKKAGAKK